MAEKTKAKQSNTSSKSSKSSKAVAKKPNILSRFMAYLRSVRQEIKRTSWPSGSEVLRMSSIVIGALLFFGILIYAIDGIMTRFVAFYATLAPEQTFVAAPESVKELLNMIKGSMTENLPK